MKWVRGLGQAIVLYEDCRLEIVSSDVVRTILKQMNQSGRKDFRKELSALWEARLQNQMIDTFRRISKHLIELEGMRGCGKVIDFEVLNLSFSLDD